MIRLLFLVPYPDLREKVEYVLKNYSGEEEIEADVRVWTVENVPAIAEEDYDAIIARGYTAKKMEETYTSTPTIDMPVSGYDIVRALEECRVKYHPRKIALCGLFGTLYEAKGICQIFGMEAEIYRTEDFEELYRMIETEVVRECDVLIGGYSANIYAKERGIPSVLIKTGEDTVAQALNEAVRIVVKVRQERLIAQTYRTIINSSKEGIFYVNDDGTIQIQNEKARKIRGKMGGKAEVKVSAEKVFPFLKSDLEEVLKSGEEMTGRIYTLPGTKMTVSADLVPVVVRNHASGAIINFSDITRIQELEGSIRKKLSSTGLRAKYHFEDIIHKSDIMEQAIEKARRYASSDSNVMIVGETGTGKELFAQSIHNASERRNGPFVAINCAALPENLLESELFGYVEGAFTGTSKGGKMGLFEQAHGGTLFLDEIGEVSPSIQTKLLRVLQEKEVRRIGDNKVVSVNVRIIAATNRSISQLAEEGKFRHDLMYRLDVLRLYLPALREREGDIRLLFRHLLGEEEQEIQEEALELLENHEFCGNIREMGNIAERVRVLCGKCVTRDDMMAILYPDDVGMNRKTDESHDGTKKQHASEKGNLSEDFETERERIAAVLEACGQNQKKAAASLGIDRTTLWRKKKKYGL